MPPIIYLLPMFVFPARRGFVDEVKLVVVAEVKLVVADEVKVVEDVANETKAKLMVVDEMKVVEEVKLVVVDEVEGKEVNLVVGDGVVRMSRQ